MQSISLADELTLEPAPAGSEQDEVLCPGVPGAPEENLAAAALRAFRASTGWEAPPLRLSIVKRIPVAAGLGGGSADAAAALRLAGHASGLGDEQLLRTLGAELGADVPAQISPGRWLATGAGERLQELPPARSRFGVLVLPLAVELSTAAVYAEADRLALARTPQRAGGAPAASCAPRSSTARRCPPPRSCCTTTSSARPCRCARRSPTRSRRRARRGRSWRSSAAPARRCSGCSRTPGDSPERRPRAGAGSGGAALAGRCAAADLRRAGGRRVRARRSRSHARRATSRCVTIPGEVQ